MDGGQIAHVLIRSGVVRFGDHVFPSDDIAIEDAILCVRSRLQVAIRTDSYTHTKFGFSVARTLV